MELNFYLCTHCGNVVEKVVDHKVPVICCGEKMQLLDPATSEGAGEKHLPVLSVEGNQVKVSVGAVSHPMEEKHSIAFIVLQTENGVQRKNLNPAGCAFRWADSPTCPPSSATGSRWLVTALPKKL